MIEVFAGFMVNAWEVASLVALVAGVAGFFVVMRGSTFVAHAVPNSAFAGAAGASLIGVNTIFGLGLFALASALTIGWLSRRGRHDVVTALAVVVMLGLGALFLSWSSAYAPEVFSLLFGEVLGVSTNELWVTGLLAAVSIMALLLLYRPLLLSAVSPDVATARGVRAPRIEMLFLIVVALVSTMAVPVVGTLLMFTLMVGPPAAARCFADRPSVVMVLSVGLALLTVWAAIALSYQTNWPIGFFVGMLGAGAYLVGRVWAWWHLRRAGSRSLAVA